MNKELIDIFDRRRIEQLAVIIRGKLKSYYEQEWHLVSDQVQISVDGFGQLGIEVNGIYQSSNLCVDFYEQVDGKWRVCWRFMHDARNPDHPDLGRAIEHNIDLMLCKKYKDEPNQKRRKFRKGKPIKTLDELVN